MSSLITVRLTQHKDTPELDNFSDEENYDLNVGDLLSRAINSIDDTSSVSNGGSDVLREYSANQYLNCQLLSASIQYALLKLIAKLFVFDLKSNHTLEIFILMLLVWYYNTQQYIFTQIYTPQIKPRIYRGCTCYFFLVVATEQRKRQRTGGVV